MPIARKTQVELDTKSLVFKVEGQDSVIFKPANKILNHIWIPKSTTTVNAEWDDEAYRILGNRVSMFFTPRRPRPISLPHDCRSCFIKIL